MKQDSMQCIRYSLQNTYSIVAVSDWEPYCRQHLATRRYIKYYTSNSVNYIAECAYLNVAWVLGIDRVNGQSTYETIGIVANSNCRPPLRKPEGLYESVECDHNVSSWVWRRGGGRVVGHALLWLIRHLGSSHNYTYFIFLFFPRTQ